MRPARTHAVFAALAAFAAAATTPAAAQDDTPPAFRTPAREMRKYERLLPNNIEAGYENLQLYRQHPDR